MLRSIKLTSRNTSVCKDLTPEFYRKQAAFPCNVTDMMSHDVLTLTRQQANPRQDSSLEDLSQKLQLHVLQSPKLACLRSCMRQLHSNQLHGKRVGGRAQLLNTTLLPACTILEILINALFTSHNCALIALAWPCSPYAKKFFSPRFGINSPLASSYWTPLRVASPGFVSTPLIMSSPTTVSVAPLSTAISIFPFMQLFHFIYACKYDLYKCLDALLTSLVSFVPSVYDRWRMLLAFLDLLIFAFLFFPFSVLCDYKLVLALHNAVWVTHNFDASIRACFVASQLCFVRVYLRKFYVVQCLLPLSLHSFFFGFLGSPSISLNLFQFLHALPKHRLFILCNL